MDGTCHAQCGSIPGVSPKVFLGKECSGSAVGCACCRRPAAMRPGPEGSPCNFGQGVTRVACVGAGRPRSGRGHRGVFFLRRRTVYRLFEMSLRGGHVRSPLGIHSTLRRPFLACCPGKNFGGCTDSYARVGGASCGILCLRLKCGRVHSNSEVIAFMPFGGRCQSPSRACHLRNCVASLPTVFPNERARL
jgi:hypothetical protein